MEDYSKHIIDAYFGKHFSERARKLFGRWLRSEDGAEQKEMLLQQAWDQSAVEAIICIFPKEHTETSHLTGHRLTES